MAVVSKKTTVAAAASKTVAANKNVKTVAPAAKTEKVAVTKAAPVTAAKVSVKKPAAKTPAKPAAKEVAEVKKPVSKAKAFKGPLVVTFEHFDETPGTFKFAELGANGKRLDAKTEKEKIVIGTLYIKKAQLGGVAPKKITVTVTAE